VFLASDHGFGPLQWRLHVDQWLADQGWLRYRGGRARVRRRLRGPMQQFKGLIPRSWLRRGRRALAVSRIIDWPQTQAYSGRTMEHAIYVNLKGREPQGIVDPDDYDFLRGQIGEALLGLRDPVTGAPIVTATYRREEIYQGPYVAEAPDLLFSLAPGYEPTAELSRQGLLSDAESEGAGIHQPEGILMLAGPGVQQGARLPDQDIQDVLPTLLYVLGLPISSVLQGRLIKAAFQGDHLASFPPTYSSQPAPSHGSWMDEPWQVFGSEDAALVEERLAALGYLR
jgi:predicted AlkP superfamily phosphohydrolase/phosphomutase